MLRMIQTAALTVVAMGILPAFAVDAVHSVNYRGSGAPPGIADRARAAGNLLYPRVRLLLEDGTTAIPDQFQIVFKRSIPIRSMRREGLSDLDEISGYVKGRRGTTIYLNWERLSRRPDDLEKLLVHEMAHVAQRYSPAAQGYWHEGMADYVCAKLGYGCPQCSNSSWHYRNGYACCAAFLLFVEQNHGALVLRDLNAALRQRQFSENFFQAATGHTLSELWAEFEKTPSFTPGAADANAFFESLGYVDGRLPKNGDLESRLRKQPGFELTSEAQKYLVYLAKSDRLPGLATADADWVLAPAAETQLSSWNIWPVERRFDLKFNNSQECLHYVVLKASRRSGWAVARAWRTRPDGTMAEEIALKDQ